MENVKIVLFNHFRGHLTIYVFMVTLLLIGIIFGAITVNSMSFVQKQDLFFYFSQYLTDIKQNDLLIGKDIFLKSYLFHLKYMLVIFILGLTIIGIPAIWLLVFIKGLILGFSVGFLVNQLGWQGLMYATLSIAPQNLIVIPVYIIASSIAMIFSLIIISQLFNKMSFKRESIGRQFFKYSSIFTILLIIVGVASIMEAYLSNELFKIVIDKYYS